MQFPGNAAEALHFYAGVFGGTVEMHTFEDFGRSVGPGDAIAHGVLSGCPVSLYGADAAEHEKSVQAEGLMFALLGVADPETLRLWFGSLANEGRIVDPFEERAWGASDGQVIDRYGIHWLLGFDPNIGGD